MRRGALLGFGHVAAGGHLPAWRARADVELVAVADPHAGRRALAETLLPAARTYASAEDLLREESLDFADVAAPPALHAPLIESALDAGCHVLCEKPLVTRSAELQRVRAAARAAHRTLFTVHNWKHSSQFRTVRDLLAAGTIGALRRIRLVTVRQGQSATVGAEWRGQSAMAGGGILVDHGWHAFYLLAGLAAEAPEAVRARLERRRTDIDVEDTASCSVRFRTVTGEIELTWAGDRRMTAWHLQGTRGSIVLDESGLVLDGPSGARRLPVAASLSAGSHHPDWFHTVIDDFFAEIDGRKRCGENLAEAEMCLNLLTAAYASAAEGGRTVSLREAVRQARRDDEGGSAVVRDRLEE